MCGRHDLSVLGIPDLSLFLPPTKRKAKGLGPDYIGLSMMEDYDVEYLTSRWLHKECTVEPRKLMWTP